MDAIDCGLGDVQVLDLDAGHAPDFRQKRKDSRSERYAASMACGAGTLKPKPYLAGLRVKFDEVQVSSMRVYLGAQLRQNDSNLLLGANRPRIRGQRPR